MDQPLPHDADDSAPSTTASASQSPPTKRRRTANAQSECCRTCRLRKVKCTGNPGTGPCSNCSRLELSCSFVVDAVAGASESDKVSRSTPSHSHTEAGTLRKRAQRACSQCHAHKTKCSGDLPSCKRCEAAGLACEYMPTRRRFTNVRFNSPSRGDESRSSRPSTAKAEETISPTSSTGTVPISGTASTTYLVDVSALQAEEFLIRKDIVMTHMNAYVQYLYWVPCLGFLHPEVTYQEIQENRLPSVQAAAICAVSSFFVDPGETAREFRKKCTNHVESHLYANITKFSEDALILFALNMLFHLLDGSFAKVWQCFGVASRLMIGLQLNWEAAPRDSTFIQQESLRRIVWQIFNLDRLLAGGYDEYISCRAENMKIRLPCNEAAFRENRPVVVERLHDKPGSIPNSIGLHGIQIRLIDLRHRIQVTTRKLSMHYGGVMPNLEPSKVMEDINGLQNELTRLHASIPDDLRLSDQTISRYAASDQWVGYVFFHTHMAGVHMDLYSFALPGPRDQASIDILRKLPREFLARSQKQAVAHAMCLGRFFDAIYNETKRMPNPSKHNLVGDYSVSNMASQCIQVLLVALQYNLYQDLADHTTAPLWRGGPTNEAQIRAFIDTMMEISEAWSHILHVSKQAHDFNKSMVEGYDKSRNLLSRQNPPPLLERKMGDSSRLPGPNIILDKRNVPGMDEDIKPRPGDVPVSDSWMGPATPQQASPATPLPMSYLGAESTDSEFGPPGLPPFLAKARSTLEGVSEAPAMCDSESSMTSASDKAYWVTPELNGMIPTNYQFLQPAQTVAGDMSIMRMDETAPDQTVFQQQQAGPEQQHFIQSQHGMFVNGYTGQYPNGQADATTYMQQNNFG